MKRGHVDFFLVEYKHLAIHGRLENWARWCRNGPASRVQPMFRLYRSTDIWAQHEPAIPVDSLDAAHMQKAVTKLPKPNSGALCWYYLKPVDPKRAARAAATTLEGLALLVRDGRQMLVNKNT